MKNVIVDFETYYDKDISVSTMGLPNYVKAADAYMVSVVGEDIEFCGSVAELITHTGTSWVTDPTLTFWAANANFDQTVWEKYLPRTAHPWQCVLDRAAAAQLPRNLADVCKVHLGVKLDKKVRDDMKGVRFEELPDAQQQRVQTYCLDDSLNTRRLVETLPEMSASEAAVAAHTRAANRRGVHIDLPKVERDVRYLERIKSEALRAIPWSEERAPLSPAAFSEFCASLGLKAPASLDKRNVATTEFLKQNPKAAKVVEHMRTLRGSNTKIEKLKTLQGTVSGGVMPLELLYCGARHTRRWSSRGFNVQNLDKAPAFAEMMAEWPEFKLSPCCEGAQGAVLCPVCSGIMPGGGKPGIFMREYLLPPPGCVFGILDFSQIEPRCLNWLCGNEELLAAIRAGYGIYEAHAKATMKWTGAPGTLKKTDPLMYHFAKMRVLALGYGMGAGLFLETAGNAGILLTAEQAEATVKEFRASNPLITQMWRKFDAQIRSAAFQNDRHLEIEMPTGEFLHHFGVRAKADGGFESFTIKGDFSQQSLQPRLWGGTLAENVTQRMARDILADSILRLEKAGFPVIFHAHDEVILALPTAGARAALKEAEALMSIPPDWCPDLPVGVDGDISPCYTKLA